MNASPSDDYPPGPETNLTEFNGRTFYFQAIFEGEYVTQILSTDGTADGTEVVNLSPPGGPFAPTSMNVVDDELLISGKSEFGFPGLWASADGITFTQLENGVDTNNIIMSNGVGYFAGTAEDYNDAPTGTPGLWRTDGSDDGTYVVPNGIALSDISQTYFASAGTIVLAGAGSDTISAAPGNVTAIGNTGTLTFLGGIGSDMVFGGTGGGDFFGGDAGGNVLVSGGASGANTTLTGAAAGDQLFGSAAGNDLILAGAERESILGGSGNTTIDGGSAADFIFTGGGYTTVNGGSAGGDTVVGGSGSLVVEAHGGDAVFGGTGSLNATGSTSGADSIIGGTGALAVNVQGANMLVVASATESDILTGNGAALVFAESGATSVTGGSGSLQVVVGSGTATITEGAGPSMYDVINGAAGGDVTLLGFKPGTDKIDLFGYSSGPTVTHFGGTTMLALTDGTKITLVGVTTSGTGSVFG